MSSIPAQSSIVTDSQAYTIECPYCTAAVGEHCINKESIKDSMRTIQYYSSGVHKARIKAYKKLHNVQGIEHSTPTTLNKNQTLVAESQTKSDTTTAEPPQLPINLESQTDMVIRYLPVEGFEKLLPIQVKVVEIEAVLHSTANAIQVMNKQQYVTWIPKSVIKDTAGATLFIKSNFQLTWVLEVNQ